MGTLWIKEHQWGNAAQKSLTPDIQDGRLEMERRGNQINTYYLDLRTNKRTLFDSYTIQLSDPVYVGLFAQSIDPGRTTMGTFSDVEIYVEE